MKPILVALGLLLAAIGGALAATYAEMAEAYQLADELGNLRGLRDLTAADINSVTIQADTSQGLKDFTLKPTDQGWNTFLSNVNTIVNNKIAANKARLTELGITGLPN